KDVVPVDRRPAAGGRQVAGEYPKGRGLAGAVRPEEPDDLTLGHLKADPVDGQDVAEGFCKFSNRDHSEFLRDRALGAPLYAQSAETLQPARARLYFNRPVRR